MRGMASKRVELGWNSRARAVFLADIALSIFYMVLIFAWLSLSPDSYGWGYGLNRIWRLVLLAFFLRVATLVILASIRRWYVFARIVAGALLFLINLTILNRMFTLGGAMFFWLLVLILIWDIFVIIRLTDRIIISEFKSKPTAANHRRISYSRPTIAAEAKTAAPAEMFDEKGYVISGGIQTTRPAEPSQPRVVMPETWKICPLCGTTNPYTASNCSFCLASLEGIAGTSGT
jgi:hypothetical protein